MKLIIDEANVKKHKLSLEEFLYLLLVYREADFANIKESLEERGLIGSSLMGVSLTERGIKKLSSFSGTLPEKIDYEEVAKKLREAYPEGKKRGTNCMWRDSTAIIARKLKTLVEKYNCQFTEEQAIRVTEEYVKSFNGDYTYMQVLKYFLLKTRTSGDGEREVTSEFMSRLENEGQEDAASGDWTSSLT